MTRLEKKFSLKIKNPSKKLVAHKMSYAEIPYEKVQPGDKIYIAMITVTRVEQGDKCYVDFSGGGLGPDKDVSEEEREGPMQLLTIKEVGENRWSSGDPNWHSPVEFVERPNRWYFGKNITMYLLRKFTKN